MNSVLDLIQKAQKVMRSLLVEMEHSGGLTQDRYQRFLSMEYHLTKGVQRHFFALAAHEDMAQRRELRKFCIHMALEEEPHYAVAQKDLENLGLSVLPQPLDVALWWAYFDTVLLTQPFVRLGGTCILENIVEGSKDIMQKLIAQATYLKPENMQFLKLHMHESLPHGAQVIQVLSHAQLNAQQLSDLCHGAQIATLVFLRLIEEGLLGHARILNAHLDKENTPVTT